MLYKSCMHLIEWREADNIKKLLTAFERFAETNSKIFNDRDQVKKLKAKLRLCDDAAT